MFNKDKLIELAGSNSTSQAIFKELGTRQRSREKLSLRKLRYDLLTKGQQVIEHDFLNTFKAMQDMGIGTIINGRLGNPTRFLWNYKVVDVAKSVNIPKKIVTPVVIKKTEPKVTDGMITNKPPVSITFNLSPNIRVDDLAALLSLVKELESR